MFPETELRLIIITYQRLYCLQYHSLSLLDRHAPVITKRFKGKFLGSPRTPRLRINCSSYWKHLETHSLLSILILRYDTIEEFNVDSKAEYLALGYLAHVARKKLFVTNIID